MKDRKIVKMIVLICILSMMSGMATFAGKVTTTAPTYTVDGELNITDWYDPNDELTVDKQTLVFSEESTGDSRIISKATAVADDSYANMVVMSGKIKFTSLPQGEKFIIGLGLESIESYQEEANNIEIHIQNNNGVTAMLVAYDENGEEQIVAPEKKCATSTGVTLSVNVTLTCKKQLIFTVNGKKVIDTQVPTSGEGHVGLMQTGNCGVLVSDFTAVFTQYDRPETTDYVETFEEGIYNQNLFTTAYYGSSRSPACMAVEEYNGNHVLMFRNAGRCYFGTKQKYSNFELTYDVPYYCRETVKNEEGKVIAAPCSVTGISFGDDSQDFNGWQFTTSVDLVHFTASSVWSYNHEPKLYNVPYSEMGFFNNDSNEGFSVKITVIDGDFTLAMKSLNAKEYKVIAKTHYDNFRTGYIKFWSTGDANMALDNFSIKNLDENPNKVETEFKSALIEVADYDYQKTENVFKEPAGNEKAEKGIDNWAIVFAGSAVLSIVILTTGILIRTRKDKRNKGGDKREI